jgi:hypothetical protein
MRAKPSVSSWASARSVSNTRTRFDPGSLVDRGSRLVRPATAATGASGVVLRVGSSTEI